MVSRILVVEDDASLQEYLRELLQEQNYTVHVVSYGEKAMQVVQKHAPDLLLLDLGLPDVSGETVCSEVKKMYPSLPIIILSARDSITGIVKGLKMGADDYLTKPFNADELLARIRVRLRENGNNENIYAAGDLRLDAAKLTVSRGEAGIHLTYTEFKLLHYLLANKGKVVSRDMILNSVWSSDEDVENRVVDVYIGHLRKKIDAKYSKKLIRSIRGFGYLIKD